MCLSLSFAEVRWNQWDRAWRGSPIWTMFAIVEDLPDEFEVLKFLVRLLHGSRSVQGRQGLC